MVQNRHHCGPQQEQYQPWQHPTIWIPHSTDQGDMAWSCSLSVAVQNLSPSYVMRRWHDNGWLVSLQSLLVPIFVPAVFVCWLL